MALQTDNKVIIANHKVLVTLPEEVDSIKCSAQAGMTIVTDDIYCISTQSSGTGKKPVALHKLLNYLPENTGSSKAVILHTASGSKNIAMHANSLTYHDHLFYLATMNTDENASQVMAFDSEGKICSKYTYSNSATDRIGTVNYYDTTEEGALCFLVSVGRGQDVRFRLVKINKTGLENVGNPFVVSVPDLAYTKGNDHYYDRTTKQLYVIKFETPTTEGSDIKNNLILQYDLSGGIPQTNTPKKPVRTLKVSAAKGEEKFEIEGISIYRYTDGNKTKEIKYVCANIVKLKNGKRMQADDVCQLYI